MERLQFAWWEVREFLIEHPNATLILLVSSLILWPVLIITDARLGIPVFVLAFILLDIYVNS